MRRLPTLAAPILLLHALAVPAAAAPFDISVAMNALPSAQGWTYTTSGVHAGVPEASVTGFVPGTLIMDTIGQTISSAGGSVLYQINGGVTTTEPKQIRVTMKCLQVQGSSVYPSGQGGTFFGFATGSVQYGFSITPTQVYMLTSSGFVLTANGLDNSSAFHDYVFDWTSATSFRIYRDGVLAGTASAGSALAANRLLFGDGTGGANAQVHIRALRFIQDLPTAAPTTTWGRVKRLYKG